MSEKTTSHVAIETDAGYYTLERLVAERVAKVTGPAFRTEPRSLLLRYLEAIAPEHRQHYNCHACARFIEKYGGLVEIDDAGCARSILWSDDPGEPFYEPQANMFDAVSGLPITGVFYNADAVWGSPVTKNWTHLAGTPGYVYKNALKTAFQAEAEKKEEYAMLRRGMAEYSREAVVQAVRVLEADAVDRSEKTLGLAKWLLDLHTRTDAAHGRAKDNLFWLAVLKAPPGWCHVKTTMIGTLLDDIIAGMDFDAIKRRWDAKMHPLQYQRPSTISEGQIQAANAMVEKLGSAGALSRRFANLSDVLSFLWQPHPVVQEACKEEANPFDHLLPKKPGVKPVQFPAQKMAWEKFRDEVLPGAREIDYMVGPGYQGFYGLVTAENPEAPALLQWDGLSYQTHETFPTTVPLPRNPVSWYFYANGSSPSHWGLTPGWCKVTGVFLKPCYWQQPGKFAHQGGGIFFALEGARDKEHNGGGSFFPECLRSEYHAVRHAMEAYSRGAKIGNREGGNANGICLNPGHGGGLMLRVRTDAGVQEYMVS